MSCRILYHNRVYDNYEYSFYGDVRPQDLNVLLLDNWDNHMWRDQYSAAESGAMAPEEELIGKDRRVKLLHFVLWATLSYRCLVISVDPMTTDVRVLWPLLMTSQVRNLQNSDNWLAFENEGQDLHLTSREANCRPLRACPKTSLCSMY